MTDEDKARYLEGEQRTARDRDLVKLSPEEIRAELKARLDSELESYISESLRQRRLAETT